jgi:hypothetical protein
LIFLDDVDTDHHALCPLSTVVATAADFDEESRPSLVLLHMDTIVLIMITTNTMV